MRYGSSIYENVLRTTGSKPRILVETGEKFCTDWNFSILFRLKILKFSFKVLLSLQNCSGQSELISLFLFRPKLRICFHLCIYYSFFVDGIHNLIEDLLMRTYNTFLLNKYQVCAISSQQNLRLKTSKQNSMWIE